MDSGSSSAHVFFLICASARKDRSGRSLRFSISIVFALTQGALHATMDFPMEEDRLRNMRLLELRAALRNNMDVKFVPQMGAHSKSLSKEECTSAVSRRLLHHAGKSKLKDWCLSQAVGALPSQGLQVVF